MRSALFVLFAAITLAPSVPEPERRTSPNYSIPAEAIDYGGRAASSSNYRNTGSAGLLGGRASNAGGTVTINGGYVAQATGTSAPLAIASAVSRKVHGASGTFDIPLPLTTPAGIECREAGAGGSHQVVVTFTTAVTVGNLSVTSIDGMASGTRSVNGGTVTVNLSAVVNAQTVRINLLNVSNGSTTADVSVLVGFLVGDTNGSGSVTTSDVGQTKSQSGVAVTSANFRNDVNVNGGTINTSDISLVKSRAGTQLP